MMARTRGFDLSCGSVKEGWRDFIPTVRNQKARKDTPCRRCRLISLCGQCPAWATLEHGDQEMLLDYLRDIAHRRAQVLGIDLKSEEGRVAVS